MKRACLTVFLLILVIQLSVSAGALESGAVQTAGDLWQHWVSQDCIPDFITGVWSTDGSTTNLTFGLLPGDTGEHAKRQILDWIADDSTVTFVTQTYSRNYLFAIMEDVNTYFEKDLGFTSAGPCEYDNVVYIELHTDYQNNPDTLAAVAELEEKYANAVSISFTDAVYHLTLDVSTEPPLLVRPLVDAASPAFPMTMLLILSVAVLIALILTENRRRMLLTHMGAAAPTPFSIRHVEEQVRCASPEIPATLDSRVQASLDDLTQ